MQYFIAKNLSNFEIMFPKSFALKLKLVLATYTLKILFFSILKVSIPRLCLSGKAPPRGTTVEMDHIEVVPNMDRWPSFHNGVAAGLRIPTGQDRYNR